MIVDLRDTSGEELPISRRVLLARGVQAGTALSALGLLAGCGGSSSSAGSTSTSGATSTSPSSLSGTLVWNDYPGRLTSGLLSTFKATYPNISFKQVPGGLSGDAQQAGQVIQNVGSYDVAGVSLAAGQQTLAANAIEHMDFSKFPKISGVAQKYRTAFPFGWPTDFGKNGFCYRTDLISERPASWREFFALIPKYSGKVVFALYDRTVIGGALLALGYNPNSTVQSELDAAQKLVISVKPDILAFLPTNITKPLARGDAVLTMVWDTDAAEYQHINSNIVWVNATEGNHSYMDGYILVKGTQKTDLAYAIFNLLAEPHVFAQYLNQPVVGTEGTIPAARPYLHSYIRTSQALNTPPGQKLYFESWLGVEGTKRWAAVWQNIQAA
jgi:spermidine/putrescine-binding protein